MKTFDSTKIFFDESVLGDDQQEEKKQRKIVDNDLPAIPNVVSEETKPVRKIVDNDLPAIPNAPRKLVSVAPPPRLANPYQGTRDISRIFGTNDPEQIDKQLIEISDELKNLDAQKTKTPETLNRIQQLLFKSDYGVAYLQPSAALAPAEKDSREINTDAKEFAKEVNQTRTTERRGKERSKIEQRLRDAAQRAYGDAAIPPSVPRPDDPANPPLDDKEYKYRYDIWSAYDKKTAELETNRERINAMAGIKADGTIVVQEGILPGSKYAFSPNTEIHTTVSRETLSNGLVLPKYTPGREFIVDVTDMAGLTGKEYTKAVKVRYLKLLYPNATQEQLDKALKISEEDFIYNETGNSVKGNADYDETRGLLEQDGRLFAAFTDSNDGLKLRFELANNPNIKEEEIDGIIIGINSAVEEGAGISGGAEDLKTYKGMVGASGGDLNSLSTSTSLIASDFGRMLKQAVEGDSLAIDNGWAVAQAMGPQVAKAYYAAFRSKLRSGTAKGLEQWKRENGFQSDWGWTGMPESLSNEFGSNLEKLDPSLKTLINLAYERGQITRATSKLNFESVKQIALANSSFTDSWYRDLFGGVRVVQQEKDGTFSTSWVGDFRQNKFTPAGWDSVNNKVIPASWDSQKVDDATLTISDAVKRNWNSGEYLQSGLDGISYVGASLNPYAKETAQTVKSWLDSEAIPSYVTLGSGVTRIGAVIALGWITRGLAAKTSFGIVTGAQLGMTYSDTMFETPEAQNSALLYTLGIQLLSAGVGQYAPKAGFGTRGAAAISLGVEILPEVYEAWTNRDSMFYDIKQVWNPEKGEFEQVKSFNAAKLGNFAAIQLATGVLDWGGEAWHFIKGGSKVDIADAFPIVFGDGNRFGMYVKNPETGLHQFVKLKPKEAAKFIKENEAKLGQQLGLTTEEFNSLYQGQSFGVGETIRAAFGKNVYEGTQRSNLNENDRSIFFNKLTGQITTVSEFARQNNIEDLQALNDAMGPGGLLGGAGVTLAPETQIVSKSNTFNVLRALNYAGEIDLNNTVISKSGADALIDLTERGFITKNPDGTYKITEKGQTEFNKQRDAYVDLVNSAQDKADARIKTRVDKELSKTPEWHTKTDNTLRKLGYTNEEIAKMDVEQKDTLSSRAIQSKDRKKWEAKQPKKLDARETAVKEFEAKGGEHKIAARKYLGKVTGPINITPEELVRMNAAELDVLSTALSLGTVSLNDGNITNNEFQLEDNQGNKIKFGVNGYERALTFKAGYDLSVGNVERATQYAEKLLDYRGVEKTADNVAAVLDEINYNYETMGAMYDGKTNQTIEFYGPMRSEQDELYRDAAADLQNEEFLTAEGMQIREQYGERPVTEGAKQAVYPGTSIHNTPQTAVNWSQANQSTTVPDNFQFRSSDMRGRQSFSKNEDGTWSDSTGKIYSERDLQNMFGQTNAEIGLQNVATTVVSDQQAIRDGAVPLSQRGVRDFDFLEPGEAPTTLPDEFVLSASDDDGNFMLLHLVRDSETGNYVAQNYKPGQVVSESWVREYIAEGNTQLGTLNNPSVAPEFGGVNPNTSVKSPADAKTLSDIKQRIRENFSEREKLIIQTASLSADQITTNNESFKEGKGIIWLDNKTSIRIGVDDSGNNPWGNEAAAKVYSSQAEGMPLHWGNRSFMNLYLGGAANVDLVNATIVAVEDAQKRLNVIQELVDAKLTTADIAKRFGVTEAEFTAYQTFLKKVVDTGEIAVLTKVDAKQLMESAGVKDGKITPANKLQTATTEEILHKALADAVLKQTGRRYLMGDEDFREAITAKLDDPESALSKFLKDSNGHYAKKIKDLVATGQINHAYDQFIHELVAKSNSKEGLGRDFGATSEESLSLHADAVIEVVETMMDLGMDVPNTLLAFAEPNISAKIETLYETKRASANVAETGRNSQEGRTNAERRVADLGQAANTEQGTNVQRNLDASRVDAEQGVTDPSIPNDGSIYSMDYDAIDRHSLIDQAQMDESTKAHDSGSGIVHISQTLKIDLDSSVDGPNGIAGVNFSETAPAFGVVDTPRRLVMNESMKNLILDLYNPGGQLAATNPQVKVLRRYLRGFTAESKIGLARTLVSKLLVDLQTAGPITKNYSFEQITAFLNLMSQFSGMTVKELAAPITAAESQTFLNSREPGILLGYNRQSGTFNDFRNVLKHEDTHATLRELGLPAKWAYSKAALDIVGRNPRFQELYKKIINRQLSAYQGANIDTVVHEVFAFGTNSADAMYFDKEAGIWKPNGPGRQGYTNLGYNPAEFKEYASLYAAMTHALANEFGVDSAKAATRYADFGLYDHINNRVITPYGTNLPQFLSIGSSLINGETSEFGGLYSMDAGPVSAEGDGTYDQILAELESAFGKQVREPQPVEPRLKPTHDAMFDLMARMESDPRSIGTEPMDAKILTYLRLKKTGRLDAGITKEMVQGARESLTQQGLLRHNISKDPDTARAMLDTDTARLVHDNRRTRKETTLRLVGLTVNGMDLDNPSIPRPVAEAIGNYVANGGTISNQKFNYKIPGAIQGVIAAESFIPQRIEKGLPLWTVGFFDELPSGPLKVRPKYANTELAKYDGVELTPENTREIQQAVLKQHAANVATNEQALEWLKNNPLSVAVPAMRLTLDPATAVREVDEAFRLATENNPEFERVMLGHYDEFTDWVKTNSEIVATQKLDRQGAVIGRRVEKAMGIASPADKAVFYEGPQIYSMDAEQVSEGVQQFQQEYYRASTLTGNHRTFQVDGKPVTDLDSLPKLVADEFRAVMANPDGPFTEEFGSMITNKLKGRATQLTDSIDFATGKLGKGADIVAGNTHTIIGVRGEVTVDPATGKATIKGSDLNGTTVDNVQDALDMLINQHVENSAQELAENANTMKFLTTKNWDVVHNTTIPEQALVKSASDFIGGLGKSVFPNLKDGMPELYSMDAGSVAPVKNIDEDGFYSNLVNFLDTGRIPDKAIAKDWLALIQKAPGVKKEEIEWNGVLSWLNENPRASLTKEEVRDYAMKHRVKAEFITLQRPPIALSNARSEAAKEVSRSAADMNSAVSTYENEKSLGIVSPELLSELKTEQDAAIERHRIAKEKYAEADRVWAEAQDRLTQYEQYVLDGDYYNYKELLMTIPNPVKGETGRIFSVQDLPYNHFLTRNPNSGMYRVHVGKPGLVESRDVTGYHPTEQDALRDFFFNRHSPGLTTFGGPTALGQSHFTEIPAVTAFSRVSGRNMHSANDTFFIEEVQSDTHQNGSVRGYFSPPNVQQIQTLVHEAFNAYGRYIENSEQLQKIFTPESLFNRLAQSQFGGRDVPRSKIFDEIIFEVTRLQNPSTDVAIAAAKESPVWLSTMLKSKGVDPTLAETNGLEIFKVLLEARDNFEVFVNKKADAITLRTQQNTAFRAQSTVKGTPVLETPFAKNWVAVLLKRAMRMAVEQGKTNFAWAPSEIHLERWATALRSNIDRFEYHRPSLVQDANTPRFSELTGSRLRSAQSQADIDSLVKDYDELTEGSTPANAEYRANLKEEVRQAKEEYHAALKQDYGTYDSEKQILDAERKYVSRLNALNYYDNIYGELADNPQGVTVTGYKNGREVFTQTLPLNGTTTINNQQVSLNQLVGNNVANQIRANKIGIITGDNLSVGGEFYKNVYDRLMVKEANSLLSKYGVQVEKTVLNQGTADEVSVWGFEIPEAFAQSVRDQGLPLYNMDEEVRTQSEMEIADAKRLISERYGKTLNPFREVSARVDLVHGTPDMTVQLMSDNMKYGQGVILSPEKKGKGGFSESENLARVEQLRKDLTAAKIRFTEVTGKWTNPETGKQEVETSFHITGTTEGVNMFGQMLAKKYGQDAYISYHRGTFTYHDLVKGTKVQTSNYSFNPDVTSEDSDLDGSYMNVGGKNVSFVADFDWSKSTKREPLSDTRMGSYYKALLKLYGVDVATESDILDIDKAPTLTLPDGRVVPTKDVVVDTVTRTPVGLVTERGSDGFATKWMPFDSALEQFPFLGDENNTARPQTFGLKNNLIAAKTKETLVNPMTGEPLVDEAGNPRLATKVPGVSIFGKALTPTGKPDYGKKGTPPPQGATRFVSLGNGLSDKNPQWSATAAMQNKLLELNTRNGVDIPKRPTVTRDQDPGAWEEYEGQLTAFTENSIEAVVRRKIAANGGKFIPPTFYISGKRVTWNNSRFEVEGYDADANNLLTSAIFAATSQMRGVKTNAREASFILSAMAALTEDTEGDVIFIPKMRQVIVDGKPTYEPELHTEGPNKGKPIKFGVATLALTKIDLATRGYRYVDAREAARLRKQGVTVEKATNVLAGEDALINEFAVPKGTKEGAFLCVKDELLTKLVNTHGPVVGLMEYVLTPDSDNLNMRAHSLLGDKIGSFFLNLAGHVNQVTIDRHMHRWWLKLTGQAITDITYDENGYVTGFKDNTLGDVPTKNADLLRGAIQKTAANLSREFGITVTPRDVQQIIWNETVNTNRAWAELTPAQMESGDYDDIYLSNQYSEGLPLPVSELISNGKLEKMLTPKSGTIPDAMKAHSDGSLDRLFLNAQRNNVPELFSADANDSLRAQQDILNLSEPLLHEGDADAWIDAAERLVAGNTAATMRGQSLLAETEKRAIKLLAEKGDVEGLQKYVLSLNKQTPLELFVNLGRVYLLLGGRTVVKNALGNTVRQVMDEIARVPASILDIAFIHFNKLLGGKNLEKSTSSLLTNPLATLDAYKAALGGAGKEGVQQFIDVLRGKNQDVIFEHPSLFREKTTGWKILKPLEILEKYGWRIQGAMDKPFNAMAYHRSLREMQQMRYREQIQAGNQITLAEAEDYLTPMDFQLAEEYALVATYQQNNTISDRYYTFVDGLPPTWRAIITNVVKFVKTPVNVMDYVLDYSGIWPIAKLAHAEFNTPDWVDWKTTAKKVLDTPESRKVMSMAISQGSIGSLMMYIGFEMAKAGLLSGWYDKEERKEQEQMEAKGTSAGKVNIGNYSIDVSWLSPNSFWLTAGASAYQSYKDFDDKLADLEQKLATATEQENQDKITEYTEALTKHKASSQSEQLLSRMLKNFALQTPFLRQMNDVVEAWNTDTTFSTLAGKWMMPDLFPGIFKEIAEAKDKYERVVPNDSFLQSMLGRMQKGMPTIPGVAEAGKALEETKIPGISQVGKVLTGRENLPAKVDMFGRPIPAPSGISGPFRAQPLPQDLLATEMDRFNLTITKPKGASSTAENELRRIKGEAFTPVLQSVVESEQYKNAPDAYKKRMLEYAIRSVTTEQRKDKFSPEEEKFNLQSMLNREAFKSNLVNSPEIFKQPLTVTDKEIIRSFAGANLPTSISMSDIIATIRKEGVDKFIDDKFMFEMNVNDRQTAAQARANYEEFKKNPQLALVRWYAASRRNAESRDRLKERRAELLGQGKSKDEVEKIIRKESSQVGAETRLKVKRTNNITITP